MGRPDGPRQSYVYAIGGDDHRHVKIGYSANPELRFATIKTSSPLDLRILKTWAGGKDLETALHKRFAHYRRQGEWFEFPADKDVIEFIGGAIEEITCQPAEAVPPPPLRTPRNAEPVRIHLTTREAAPFYLGDHVRVTAPGWEGRPDMTVSDIIHSPMRAAPEDPPLRPAVHVFVEDPLLPGHLRIFRGGTLQDLVKVGGLA